MKTMNTVNFGILMKDDNYGEINDGIDEDHQLKTKILSREYLILHVFCKASNFILHTPFCSAVLTTYVVLVGVLPSSIYCSSCCCCFRYSSTSSAGIISVVVLTFFFQFASTTVLIVVTCKFPSLSRFSFVSIVTRSSLVFVAFTSDSFTYVRVWNTFVGLLYFSP